MNSDKEEKILKKILSRGTELKAPSSLCENVLNAFRTEKTPALSFPALIPTWFLCCLGIAFSGIIIWVLAANPSGTGGSIFTTYFNRITGNIDFTFLQLDPVMITAFLVTAIMFFINAYLNKLYYTPRN